MDKILLQDKFDHIFCLNMTHRQDRRDKMIPQLESLGLLNADNFSWHFATTHVGSDICAQVFNHVKRGSFTFPNEFNCAREHYSIVKQAYDFGYSNVLVLEDDLLFTKDEKLFQDTLKYIPEGWDVLQFGGYVINGMNDIDYQKLRSRRTKESERWIYSNRVWNCSMYALSRKGMKYYMSCQEKFFTVADNPLYIAYRNRELVNAYISIDPIVIQDWGGKNKSDIRTKESEEFNVKMNDYEKGIDLNSYGLF